MKSIKLQLPETINTGVQTAIFNACLFALEDLGAISVELTATYATSGPSYALSESILIEVQPDAGLWIREGFHFAIPLGTVATMRKQICSRILVKIEETIQKRGRDAIAMTEVIAAQQAQLDTLQRSTVDQIRSAS